MYLNSKIKYQWEKWFTFQVWKPDLCLLTRVSPCGLKQIPSVIYLHDLEILIEMLISADDSLECHQRISIAE